jgi:general L-amino acid transport system substrate-binding protein
MSHTICRKERRPRAATNATRILLAGLVLLGSACAQRASAGGRLSVIRQRGYLVCGVAPGVAGFSDIDASGHHIGLDVDICRALSASIFGAPDKVTYVQASSVEDFLRSNEIDVVSRRLTWSLTREGIGLLFGPVTFYDGQGFLVSRRLGVKNVRQLSGTAICVEAGTSYEFNIGSYFSANELELKKIPITSRDEIALALAEGRCQAYTADVSELGSLRSKLASHDDFDILTEQISKEPLAQVVRQEDVAFFEILRWTVFAAISAEELGITSSNVDQMSTSQNPDIRRLLGVIPGNGKALGLDERWAYHVIKHLGNYGEIFDRNVGSRSPINLRRGLNNLWTAGGLIYAPPLR